jgi:hypothetical protein
MPTKSLRRVIAAQLPPLHLLSPFSVLCPQPSNLWSTLSSLTHGPVSLQILGLGPLNPRATIVGAPLSLYPTVLASLDRVTTEELSADDGDSKEVVHPSQLIVGSAECGMGEWVTLEPLGSRAHQEPGSPCPISHVLGCKIQINPLDPYAPNPKF